MSDLQLSELNFQSEWSTQELSFMVFKNRGELLLRGDTTAETVSQVSHIKSPNYGNISSLVQH